MDRETYLSLGPLLLLRALGVLRSRLACRCGRILRGLSLLGRHGECEERVARQS